MALSVKKKIWLGTLFLFMLLLVSGGIGIYHTAKLKKEAQNVLQDNYESLAYCHTMQQQMNNVRETFTESVYRLENALAKEEQNITEPGEGQAVTALRQHVNKLKNGDTSHANMKSIETQIQSVLMLNMQAIQRKSRIEETTAESALSIIIALSAIVFIVAFTFLVNFPSIVTKPITRLTEAIREIANKNYKHRIHIDNKDEFGKLADAFNEMAERLEYFESSSLNKILFEKNRAEAVINSLKDASFGIDKNNCVLFANYQALQLLGMRSEDIVGKPVNELKVGNDLLRFLLHEDSSAPFKIVVDNRENFFVKEVVEVGQGETNNKVIVLKNITSFKELDAAKTNFIATISHELKTPLASSDFSLKLLEDERVSTLSPEQKELIENLKNDNRRMLKILSELLNMSQVETGRMQLNITKVNAASVVQNAVEAVAGAAKEKEIVIRNTTPANLPPMDADADKTMWILNNFLTNAIKYSFSNSEVEIGATQQNGAVIFFVKDSGPGIEQVYLPRLFEPYFQVPGSKEKGTGLGLSISKEFAEAQRGKIWVDSNIGRGAVFYFQLPL